MSVFFTFFDIKPKIVKASKLFYQFVSLHLLLVLLCKILLQLKLIHAMFVIFIIKLYVRNILKYIFFDDLVV